MQTTDDKRRQIISAALARQRGDPAGEAIALTMHRWSQLAGKLTPLIGEAGFCALFGRSVRLHLAEFRWLTLSDVRASEPLFQRLGQDLTTADPSQAQQACAVLLDTFTTLLSALIGAELTTRILVSAWNEEPYGDTKEMHK